MARSSSGQGHRPLKAEITGSNPVRATSLSSSGRTSKQKSYCEFGPLKDIRIKLKAFDVWLLVAIAIGAGLRLSRLGDFDNQYYTAAVASMLQGTNNFFFASFDPGGVVMIDKPPMSFWIQCIPAAIFGVNRWSVTAPQVVAGTVTIIILYIAIRPAFGRMAAISAGFALAVIPASVAIDSRNEPDSLLSLVLMLAALSIIWAVRTGKAWWLIVFAVLMGIAFNTKMLVAFVPLPAFLLYSILAARVKTRQAVTRTIFAVMVLLVISFSWVSLIALTPPENRPYVGSTQDNSIWTLTFEYNGIDRFTSLIAPRPRSVLPPSRGAGSDQKILGLPPSRYPVTPIGYPPWPPSAISSDMQGTGILGLFNGRLAAQLGWLLPLGLFSLVIVLAPLLTEKVYHHPRSFFPLIRVSPTGAQGILWGGWFGTAVVVFGLASSTVSHPYYLVGVAVPLAAVLGIALSFLFQLFRDGAIGAWLLPGALMTCLIYQVHESYALVGDWATIVGLVAITIAITIVAIAIYRGLTTECLAKAAIGLGAVSVLVIPMALAATMEVRGVGTPPIHRDQEKVNLISSFIADNGDGGVVFTVGTMTAREAAPFIVSGVSAVAIGGFSGSDPVFSIESFRSMVERGDLRYFLVPPDGGRRSSVILNYIRLRWKDVSGEVGLPTGTLYRYSG